MGRAKTATSQSRIRSVKKTSSNTTAPKTPFWHEAGTMAAVKAAKGAVAASAMAATGAKRKRKKTIASIAAKARRQNAKTD